MSANSPVANVQTTVQMHGTLSSQQLTANFEDVTGTESAELQLNETEIAYLKAASKGKINKLRTIVEQYNYFLTPLDIDCSDSLDRTALTLAILNGHMNVVKFLLFDDLMLDNNLSMGDALFHAIDHEMHQAICLLLSKDPQIHLQILPGTTSPFAPGLTPLMLAAHKNNYKIIRVLHRYGHRLHDLPDTSGDFTNKASWDSVMENLLHYEARASPAYMLLMYSVHGFEWDPVVKAMELYGELMRRAEKADEVSERYVRAAQNCEQFVIDLLENVRSASELSGLMRFPLDGSEFEENSLFDKCHASEFKRRSLQAISKACNVKMMDFVTSDNAQLALTYVYRGDIFRNSTGNRAMLKQALIGLMFPFLSIAQLIFPMTYVGKLSRNPAVKYWSHVMSELVFIGLLIANTIMTSGKDEEIPPLLGVSYFWILGKLVQEGRELLRSYSPNEYFENVWNWNDLACIAFFTAYMSLRLVYIARKPEGYIDRFDHRYGVYWYEDKHNLLPISDIFIAFAYIFIFVRIMELLRASRYFGPLQLSLDRMAKDAIQFLILFAVFFFAFGTSITQIFLPYGHEMGCSCDPVLPCQQRNYSSDLPKELWPKMSMTGAECPEVVHCKGKSESLQQLTHLGGALYGMFWTLFGYGSPDQSWMKMNCPDKQYLTWAGTLILGAYHFCGIVVLLNMLIAMMSSSFQKTTDNSEKEWKFHRTQLWLKYIHNDVNRPPPMNLLPNIVSIASSLLALFRKMRRFCNVELPRVRTGKAPINNVSWGQNPSFVLGENPTLERTSQDSREEGIEEVGDTSTPVYPEAHPPEETRYERSRKRIGSNVFLSKADQAYSQTVQMVVTRYIKQKVNMRDENSQWWMNI